MVDRIIARMIAASKRKGFYLYLKQSLVEDSSFPFKPDDRLIVRIEGKRLVVERFKA